MEEELSWLLLSALLEIKLQPISIDIAINLLIIILMLFCSAVVSGAEVAYFCLAPNDIESLNNDKSKKATKIKNFN